MKVRLEDLRSGDLVLYISQSKATQAQSEHRLPNPVINVFQSTGSSDLSGKKALEFYSTVSYGLLPDDIAINGKKHARINLTQWNGSAIYEMLVELRAGKKDILDYLDTRPDLAAHKGWITDLREPFQSSFPPIIRVCMI
jgi:hypothetical protein